MIQNVIAVGSANVLGLPNGIAPFIGSASLIGGHGTTIAWAPIITERFGIANALEVGIATATLGLVVASLVGGPIAGYLIKRYSLSGPPALDPVVGLPDEPAAQAKDDISHVYLLHAKPIRLGRHRYDPRVARERTTGATPRSIPRTGRVDAITGACVGASSVPAAWEHMFA